MRGTIKAAPGGPRNGTSRTSDPKSLNGLEQRTGGTKQSHRGPFDQADRKPPASSALSAHKVDTALQGAQRLPFPAESPRTVSGRTTGSSSQPLAKNAVSSGTSHSSRRRRPAVASGAQANDPTFAPSVVPPVIEPSIRGASERDRIITPYNADAFELALKTLGLLSRYPNLPNKIRYGFPIGDFDILSQSFTPPNHPSAAGHMQFINDYVSDQVKLGRMSGPYSQSQTEEILGSYFVSSPLAVVEKPGSPAKLRLVQNCSFKDENGISVNDQIDLDDFPTTWGTAAQVAQIVSTSPSHSRGPARPESLEHVSEDLHVRCRSRSLPRTYTPSVT